MATDTRIGWRVLRRAVAAGALAAVIAGGVAFIVSQSLPKGYEAEAQVLVGSLTATSTDELDAYHRLALTYAELATSSPLLTRAIDRLGLGEDAGQLAKSVDARAGSQGIVVIRSSAGSPTEASQIANAIAAEVLALATPEGRLTSLAAVVQPAIPPDRASWPNVLINTLVATCLGLSLGVGAVLFLENRESAPSSSEGVSSVAWPGRP